MTGWSPGQQQALDQLQRIAGAGPGSVVLSGEPERGKTRGCRVRVTLDFSDVAARNDGLVGPAETVIVDIPTDFPSHRPQASVEHERFAGLPHILWKRYICLYLSDSDWDPSDGMFGFMERLADWFVRAATGTLEETGQPLHPPLARPVAGAGCVVIPVDFPDIGAGETWLGMSVLSLLSESRAEVLRWLPLKVLLAGKEANFAATRQLLEAMAWRRDRPVLLGPVVVLPGPLGFEFPETIGSLSTALAENGIDRKIFIELLSLTASLNLNVARGDHELPLYAFIGAPMRGVAGNARRRPHLAVWRLAKSEVLPVALSILHGDGTGEKPRDEALAAAAAKLLALPVSWEIVYEQRPQIVHRRDSGSPAAWLHGKKVLVLGCGALGARVAEHCLRGGAASITVADEGGVNPGILVRQPYCKDDIGLAKAAALAGRLSRIDPAVAVRRVVGDILTRILAGGPPPAADLIVDATASRAVSARIEWLRWQSPEQWPPILTVGVGHDCQRGIVSLAFPEASGAGADMLQELALTALARPELADVAGDFFLPPGQRKPFQPEPGCSDATFQGSDAEAAALAAQMFAWGVRLLRDRSLGRPVAPRSMCVFRLFPTADGEPSQISLAGQNDVTADDEGSGYQIRFRPEALAGIRAEALSTARHHGDVVETGGMLLGRIDDACRVIWVTAAEGPTPDSERAPHHFRHGLVGVAERIAAHRKASGDRTRFVGMWHTHPGMSPEPSSTDLTAMETLLMPGPAAPPRGILAVFGGRPAAWDEWLHGAGSPHLYARLYQVTQQEPRAPVLPRPLRGR